MPYQYEGNLKKMKVLLDNPVQYTLELTGDEICMNDLIGKEISLTYSGKIHCKRCGRLTKKSFSQGFCYPCFQNAPENSPCIIHPELCEAHLGKGRDVEWEKEHHFQPHFVYLALTSTIKVGVTRATQIPTRWIDQGAWKAIRLAEVPYRNLAGQIEVALKDFLTDKTNWRHILQDVKAEGVDLIAKKHEIKNLMPDDLRMYFSTDDEVTEMVYPVEKYLQKISSVNFDKTPELKGRLQGIRGQYLIFNENRVINIRKFTGYFVNLKYE